MLLRENLARIFELTKSMDRVLDVGGAYSPLNSATHVMDILPECVIHPLDPDMPVRFSTDTHIQFDMCRKPWPFPDKYFDFAFCSHTLEDVRDPIGASEEMMRVAKAGYVEVPSRTREAFHYKSGYLWRRIIGRPLRIGWEHHRWFCERDGDGLLFTAKTSNVLFSRRFFITFDELGRQLTPEESSIGFFWTKHFKVSERILPEAGAMDRELLLFKQKALSQLKSKALIR